MEEEKARPKKDKNKTETKCSGKTSANTTKERGGGKEMKSTGASDHPSIDAGFDAFLPER